ncbi:helix-turn-helix domain-containing protein [Paraburkholderia sp. MM6662-R1]|uniref:helix-turn-helix domain-containing protein n=1 Tax=Paraburkholderia sp. MM6662-R1 TaxID=2991066 RepID=UPI003D250DC5
MHNFLSFNCIIDNWPDNTAAHQRARLLEAMRVHAGVTTLEAMRFLDIVDPRARIVELRKEGYRINTSWVHQPSECERLHAVGMYTLTGNVERVAITRASQTPRDASSQQMRLAFW